MWKFSTATLEKKKSLCCWILFAVNFFQIFWLWPKHLKLCDNLITAQSTIYSRSKREVELIKFTSVRRHHSIIFQSNEWKFSFSDAYDATSVCGNVSYILRIRVIVRCVKLDNMLYQTRTERREEEEISLLDGNAFNLINSSMNEQFIKNMMWI